MDIQRLRNLTTGILHTSMDDIHEDIEKITGSEGIFTHQLPNAATALEPYLRGVAPDPRLWEEKHDATHTGEIDVPAMSIEDTVDFWLRYNDLPSPLAGRSVILAVTEIEKS